MCGGRGVSLPLLSVKTKYIVKYGVGEGSMLGLRAFNFVIFEGFFLHFPGRYSFDTKYSIV